MLQTVSDLFSAVIHLLGISVMSSLDFVGKHENMKLYSNTRLQRVTLQYTSKNI